MTIWWWKTLTCPICLLYCNVQEYKDSIKDVFIYLFILLLLLFLMKVNLCLKWADGSDDNHKCAIMSQILVYIFCWMLLLAKKWNFSTTKHLSDQNERCKRWNYYILLCLKVGTTCVESGVDGHQVLWQGEECSSDAFWALRQGALTFGFEVSTFGLFILFKNFLF